MSTDYLGTNTTISDRLTTLLRLTRKSRTAHHNMMIGIAILFGTGLLLLPLMIVEPRPVKAILILDSALFACALVALFQRFWQLHFALNPSSSQKVISSTAATFAAPLTQALPASFARASVTEGTTELLVSAEKVGRRTLKPVSTRVNETGEVDAERFM